MPSHAVHPLARSPVPLRGPAVVVGNVRRRVRAMGAFLTNDLAGSSRGRLVITEACVQYAGQPTNGHK